MGKILSILFVLWATVAAADGSPFSVSGASSEFVVDTRPDIQVDDVTSPYCSGEYGGQGGVRQTFISGVRCSIKFKISASGRDGNPVSHYLVNGQRQTGTTFTFNVGSLPPEGRLTVVAVDNNGNESKPFRVNIEMAPAPTMWTHVTPLVIAEYHPKEAYVNYKSPEAQVFGLFNAISSEADVGGSDLPLSFAPSFKVWQSADSSTGQYKEGVDIGSDAGNDEVELFGKVGGLDISLGSFGSVVYDYNPRTVSWNAGSGEVGFRLGGSWTYRQRLPQCPLIFGEIGLAAAGEFALRRHGDGNWYGEINLDPLIEISAAVGVGVDFVGEASIYGAGGISLEASLPGGLNKVDVKGRFGWRVKALSVFESSGIWWEASHSIYQRSRALSSPALLDAGLRPSGLLGTSGGFRPIARDYGDGIVSAVHGSARRKALLAASAADDVQVLMHDGFPTPQPAIALFGTHAMLVYARDNAARSDLNRTELMFREETTDGSWSGEIHVWDDGTADFQPKLVCLPDGTAISAWANAKRTFADDTSFESVCAALESAVGVRDPQSGVWTCANLTDDAALDWVPVLKGATNGTAAVAWVRNAAGAYIGTTEQPSDIAVSFFRNGTWGPVNIAVGGIGAVLSHDIAWDGGRAVLTWAVDPDGDLMTEDAEIWAKSFENGTWSLPVRLSAASAGAMRPSAWFLLDGTPHVLWVQGGSLFAASGLVGASGARVATAAGAHVPNDYRISVRENGSATLLWTVGPRNSGNGLEDSIMSVGYAPDTGLAEPASLLHRESALLRNISGATGSTGVFRVAFESVSVTTNAEGHVVQGAVDLAVFGRETARDVGVAADDCSFANSVEIGLTNKLLVGFQNYGTVVSGTFEYRVWIGEGDDKMLLASGEVDIPPLSCELVEVPWTPVEGLTDISFTIELDPENQIGDMNRENNTLTWRPDVGNPILSLRNAKAVKAADTLRLISARIHNAAVTPLSAGMTVKFWRGEIGGELIGTDMAGVVAGGNAGEYDVGIAWDISGVTFTSEWERVVIELPAEQGGGSVAVWTPTPLYDPDNDIGPGGGGGSGGGSVGGETPSAPPDIGGIVGFGEVDGGQRFHFYFYGEAGFTYLVQYKEKLTDVEWATIETVTPTTTGECPVAVPIFTSAPSGFYRVVTNP